MTDKEVLPEQLSLDFELLIDAAKRICDRYSIGTRRTPMPEPSVDQRQTAS
jgi:hypothetical protein